MKISEILEFKDNFRRIYPKLNQAPGINELMENKLREIVKLIPEIERLLYHHYHTDLEDEAHDMLLKLTFWQA